MTPGCSGTRQAVSAGPSQLQADEVCVFHRSWRCVEPIVSVLVPTYRDSVEQLLAALEQCERADEIEVIIYDDGSDDAALLQDLKRSVQSFPGAACLITATQNKGRSEVRNRLQNLARSDWLLFLDADMVPDDPCFLSRYLNQLAARAAPRLVVGGFSLKQATRTSANALHWAQSIESECLPADSRSMNPGRYVFTSNVLAHRRILVEVPFDPAFQGWGWEDVDWGIRVAERFPVEHIDNPATHLGLDPPEALLRKYEASGVNFWLVANRHPASMEKTLLVRLAKLLSRVPGRVAVRELSRMVAKLPGWLMPVRLRLGALKLFRAAVYGGTRHERR